MKLNIRHHYSEQQFLTELLYQTVTENLNPVSTIVYDLWLYEYKLLRIYTNTLLEQSCVTWMHTIWIHTVCKSELLQQFKNLTYILPQILSGFKYCTAFVTSLFILMPTKHSNSTSVTPWFTLSWWHETGRDQQHLHKNKIHSNVKVGIMLIYSPHNYHHHH